MKLLRQYMVIGDPETGEWLTEPGCRKRCDRPLGCDSSD